jgi:hypothetical protein
MKRTTIMADEALLLEAKHVAEQRGTTLTAVVHEALEEYLRARRQPHRFSFAGTGRSGRPHLGHEAEALLSHEIDEREGWSPRRGASRVAAPGNGSPASGQRRPRRGR